VVRRLAPIALCLAGCLADPAGADGGDVPDGGGGDASAAADLAGADLTGADLTPPPPDLMPYPEPTTDGGATKVSNMTYVFTEGPVWRAAQGVLLFSDVTPNLIYQLAPPSTVTPFRNNSGGANGNALDPQGLLVTCEGNAHRVTRTLANGTVTPLASTYNTNKLNSPNDVIVRSDGTVYFTDPNYGARDPADHPPFEAVYRISPQGTLSTVDTTLTRPNGIALSPYEQTLYVDDEPNARVMRYTVNPDGTTSAGTKLTDTSATPDGMGIDDAGNLYVTTAAGVEIYRPAGTKLGTLTVAEQPANCAFGGSDRRTLYITARTGLYQYRQSLGGKP